MEPRGHPRKNIPGRGHKTPKWKHVYAQPIEKTMTGIDKGGDRVEINRPET